ncbi:MAG: hypothetical protein GY803_13580 [Chloroflexi bacterium]|nr:hypothetical protein [Chloroflexota bacterium]
MNEILTGNGRYATLFPIRGTMMKQFLNGRNLALLLDNTYRCRATPAY